MRGVADGRETRRGRAADQAPRHRESAPGPTAARTSAGRQECVHDRLEETGDLGSIEDRDDPRRVAVRVARVYEQHDLVACARAVYANHEECPAL